MGGGGSAPQPAQVDPGEAAQAAIGTAGAGEQMSIANQPVEQYSNLYTTQQLGPAETQTQGALANQAAMQSAQAQQAIQSSVDPMAYAQRQMRLKAATDRLGQLYQTDPTAYRYTSPAAFTVPGMAGVPSLSTLGQAGKQMASNLALGSVDESGGNPTLNTPFGGGTNLANVPGPQTYY
jgi:hypothetical protein